MSISKLFSLNPESNSKLLTKATGLLPAVVVVLLAGCGGGGSDSTSTASGVPRTTAATPATSPAPLPAPAAESASAAASAPQPSVIAPDGASCGLNGADGIRTEVLTRINTLRATGASCGTTRFSPAPALSWNNVLLQAASAHATDMSVNNYFSHNSQNGKTPPQRILTAGYSYASMGENIAAGQPSVEAVMKAWQDSPGHCVNLMNPAFSDVAVACKSSSTSTYGLYWVMELGRAL
jgi:uncharacterized protein YkwD